MTADQRLPKHQRLATSAQFGRVFAAANRTADRNFTILARPSTEAHARLGITVSKRAAKLAVDRNRIKRLVREAFRSQTDLPTWDFVVVARPPARDASNAELTASLTRQIARLALTRSS